MNQSRKRLQRALGSLIGRKQDKPKLIPAMMGAYFNGQKTIVVANRPDYVYCRLRGATSERVQAFNDAVAHHWDLPILIYRDPESPGAWRVWGRDIARYESWGGDSYLPPHGRSHSFFGNEGADPVWIAKRQYMPLLVHPNPTGTMAVYIEPDFYYLDGQYHWWPGSGTADLSAYKPTGSFNARYVTIYIDGNTESLGYTQGPEFNAYTPPPDPGDYIALPAITSIPLAAVYMLTGTKRIGWNEIYDLRLAETPPPGTGTFSPSDLPSPIIGVMGWDDGVPLGTGTVIDFGDNIDVTLSGAVLRVDVDLSGITSIRPRSGSLIALTGETGLYWQVPDLGFATGSVAIMVDGIWQRPVIDFTEQFAVSGTILLGEAPITGSVLAATWGVAA